MIAWFLRKKKEVSSETKKSSDDFVSLSSHELRSPLSIIRWYTEILLDEDAGPLTEDQRKYLKVIEASNQRAIDLVRSLLNVSRLDLDTFSVSPEEVSVSNIINECITSCKPIADQKVITVNFADNDTNFPILLDKRLTSLVIKNILLNAVSFSKHNGKVLVERVLVQKGKEIGGRKVTEESVVVTIKDNGIGIPFEDQSKIFSKMFKARNVKDSDTTGSGLGLYIAKTVMDITGGSLWFISSAEEGSTFFIAFPTKGMKKKAGTTTLD